MSNDKKVYYRVYNEYHMRTKGHFSLDAFDPYRLVQGFHIGTLVQQRDKLDKIIEHLWVQQEQYEKVVENHCKVKVGSDAVIETVELTEEEIEHYRLHGEFPSGEKFEFTDDIDEVSTVKAKVKLSWDGDICNNLWKHRFDITVSNLHPKYHKDNSKRFIIES